MAKVPLTVSFADRLDETASRADAVCPDHHFLEAWGDAEPVESYYSLAQPTIAPLFDTRADSLAFERNAADYLESLKVATVPAHVLLTPAETLTLDEEQIRERLESRPRAVAVTSPAE